MKTPKTLENSVSPYEEPSNLWDLVDLAMIMELDLDSVKTENNMDIDIEFNITLEIPGPSKASQVS